MNDLALLTAFYVCVYPVSILPYYEVLDTLRLHFNILPISQAHTSILDNECRQCHSLLFKIRPCPLSPTAPEFARIATTRMEHIRGRLAL